MRGRALLAAVVLLMGVILPNLADARAVHYFTCADCHRSGLSLTSLDNNVCFRCHGPGAQQYWTLNDTSLGEAIGRFISDDASDAIGSNTNASPTAPETSHFWASMTENVPEAGATTPVTYATKLNGKYGLSRGKVICSRCHDPHQDNVTNPQLLKVINTNDVLCRDCHRLWDQSVNSGHGTHPMVADYETRAGELNTAAMGAGKPPRFKTNVVTLNTLAGEMRLVGGGVSCTTCHGVHFTDSDSSTLDGMGRTLNPGDGHLLRADGPTQADKSALCQSCHLYKSHGNPSSGDYVEVGCLVCHSGHSYNDDGPNPNYFVLRRDKKDPHTGTDVYDQDYTVLGTLLNDKNDLTQTGFCERCHGAAQSIPNHGPPSTRYTRDCRDCHFHDVAGGNFSWKYVANPDECGACHGFPPYKDIQGNRVTIGDIYDGGYAYISAAHNYDAAGYRKAENTTPHNSHAAGGLPQADPAGTDYIFGTGSSACDPCHLGLANHREASDPGNYQDLNFNTLAKGNTPPYTANLSPSYTTTGNGSCTNVYCHSNGGQRTNDGAKTFKFAPAAPVWGTGDNDIIGIGANECAYACHGNSTTTMATGAPLANRSNSVAHIEHLTRYTNLRCNICHVSTATSNTALAAGARIQPGGKHVNGKPDIGFDTAYDLDTVMAGVQGLTFNTLFGDSTYSPNSGYNQITGVCNVYCHSNGPTSTYATIAYAAVDWDSAPAVFTCASCHGNPPTSGSHTRHVADANGPTLACSECHVNAASYTTAGGHTDHINGRRDDAFSRCNTCHAIDAGAPYYETAPIWGNSTSMDCKTCHTGTLSTFETKTAPDKTAALTSGHNRPTASSNYPAPSGNLPANKLCTDCHDTKTQAGHFDLDITDKLVKTGSGFPATYASDADKIAFCGACHGASPTWPANKRGIITHLSKACTACHDPHSTTGSNNIFMIRPTSTGNYNGTVAFIQRTTTDSYDEDDGAAGNPDENNADDLCATCHTYGGGSVTGHNNKENLPTTAATSHHQGENCMTGGCHKGHTDTGGAFKAGGGSLCSDCHGNPPTAADPRYSSSGNGTTFGAHAMHFWKSTDDPTEDRTDCEICHPGAATYALDHTNGGALNLDARITVLGGGNYSCGTLNSALGCHQSDSNDGFWKDTTDYAGNGLRCTACHSNGINDGVLANAAPNTGAHTKHVTANKTCTDCHNGGFAITDTTHITNHGVIGPATNDGDVLADRAKADLGEGNVSRTGGTMTYDQATLFTCSGGIGLGCHNSKTGPNWRTFTGIACTNCHTAGGSDAADPTSGLHSGTLTVTGNTHDNSFSNGDGGTATCDTCHTTSPSSEHYNGLFTNSYPTININGNMGFTDGPTPTCGPNATLMNCHSDNGIWARRWSGTAHDTSGTTMCANCHGTFGAWNTGVIHTENPTRGSGHGNTGNLTYPCTDCHVIGSTTNNYLFTLGSNDWQAVELGTTKHGDNLLQMNSTDTGFTDAGARAGCATVDCHGNDGNHDFPKSTLFTTLNTKLVTVAGDRPPVSCFLCHGGSYSTTGGSQSNYWPDKDNSFEGGGNLSEDNKGRHDIHMQRLARAVYDEDYLTDLLKDDTLQNPLKTSDEKQKALCDYCHAGATNHGDKVNLPAEVTTMYYMWTEEPSKTADSNASWNTPTSGNCSNVNCHNGKPTSDTTDFTWYGAGSKNCRLCHNNIEDTTAGTTGATHQAHIGPAASIFGKAINCGSCHGGSPTWEADTTPDTYAVPSAEHINGTFSVTNGTVTVNYLGSYTDYATHTFGSCNKNSCHNNGKDVAPAAYSWGNAITGTCTACHGNTDTGLAEGHDGHLLASGTFGRSISCPDCHDAVSDVSMNGMTNHMNGTVNLTGAVTYTGDVAVNGTTWGLCNNSSCHRTSLTQEKNSPTWNTTASGCSTCHGSTDVTLTSGRHADHLPNVYISNMCGECHTANANNTSMAGQATHMDGTVNIGGTQSVNFATAPGCTNSCHKVNVATSGDWADTNPLLCTDCHQAGTIAAAKGALPTSGLHNMTANGVQKHNDTLLGGPNGCTQCHASPDPTHLNGAFAADTFNNGDRFVNRSGMTWADGAANSGTCFDSGTTSLNYNAGAGCHRDNGVWKRLWSTEANVDMSILANQDPGLLVCDVCHGQYQSLHASSKGWREGSVHYLSGGSADEDKGGTHNKDGGAANKCKDCHAYYAGGVTNHQNGALNFSGNGTTDYSLATGTSGLYCATCHNDRSAEVATDTGSHTFPATTIFGSPVYVGGPTLPSGNCTTCHGNAGTTGIWPDDSVTSMPTANQSGEHPVHVLEIAKKLYSTSTPSVLQQNSTCDYCHPGNSHGGVDASLPADVSRTDANNDGTVDAEALTYMKKIIGGAPDNNPTKSGFWRRTPGTCSNVACHASAPFTPHWYADTVAPANITLTAAAGPVPRSIKLTWTSPGDDGTLDGTAYKYDIRMGSGASASTTATNFGLTTNYVQGVPTVKRMGSTQEAIIHNVSPSTSYAFALRTYDRAGNYGGTANAGGYVSYTTPAAATLDNQAPVLTGSPTWYGLDSAKVLDTSGAVKLAWTRAEDHSMPITYDIWWSTGTITYGAPQASTKDTSFRVTGLTDNNTYNFAVRAKDDYNNTDTNTATLQAVPQGLSEVPKTSQVHFSGTYSAPNVTMNTSAYTGTAGSSTLTTGIYFIAGATYHATANTNVFADTFSVYISNTNSSNTVTAELGYYDTAFHSFTTTAPVQTALTKSVTLAARAKKAVPFKFGEMRWVPGGKKLAVKLTQTAAGTVNWGTATNRGDLTTQIQPINTSPSTPTITTLPVSGANVSFYWAAASDSTDGVADTVHYDVYGDDGTGNFSYVIATGLTTNATVGSPLVWDTQAAGIALTAQNTTVRVRVEAGDTINGKTLSHTAATSGNLTVNAGDKVAPGAITNLKAETRPKQGSIYLTWTSPGDDGSNNGRASSYDIRWATAVIDNDTKFDNAIPLVSEPYPDFGGNGQGYEVLDLAEGNYFFAIKALDEALNSSSLAYTTATTAAGPKCGICHSTPPDEDVTKGNHAQHGYTMTDCSNCHGNDTVLGAQNFTTAHQDGVIKLGWKTASPATAIPDGSGYKYQQGGLDIYVDNDGSGGFNPAGDGNDDGSCGKWDDLLVGGCHGPAELVPWVAGQNLACSACHGEYRTLDNYSHSFDDPSDDVKAAPPVDNHGFTGEEALEGQRKYVGAHVAHLNYSFRLSKGDSCRLCHGASRPGSSLHADGNIDVKLDLAAAGPDAEWLDGIEDPDPAVRTAGTCGSMSPDSCHPSTATPKWDSAVNFACTNCHGMGGTTPSHVTDTAGSINLPDNDPDNDPDGVGPLPAEPMPGNCTWCHVGGHPKEKKVTAITKANPAVVTTENNHNLANGDKVTIHTKTGMTEINNKTFIVTVINATQFSLQGSNTTAYGTFDYGTWIEGNGTGIILVANDSRVGINYQSGGVHLKANIASRGEMASEAALCWGCHAPNSISEWGADSTPSNATGYQSGNGNNYNFGQIYLNAAGGTVTSNWLGDGGGAFWRSGYTPGFNYKDGRIRSTHSTDPTGSSTLTGSAYNYSETLDPIEKIRCSNCHDVHNLNKAPEDNPDNLASLNGPPYLRGTWRSSPYKEDGAPQQGTSYTSQTGYLALPRSSASTTNAMGGYWIDQNSGNPTAGWSYETSAGLCQLCHGASVDALDYAPSGAENLWLSSNGHANSVLGGSGTGAVNIFKNGITSNIGRQGTGGADVNPNPGVWMGFQITYTEGDYYGYGPRSGRVPYLSPTVSDPKTNTLVFAWGVTVDASSTEIGYHQFSCSKCHNPHASRLPKLMITNCLDVSHNTWDLSYDNENGTKWTSFQTTASSWNTQKLSYLSTAQNCHRLIDLDGNNTPDESGWNKVTPW